MVKCRQPVKFHIDSIEFWNGDSLTSQAKRTRDFNVYLLDILADKYQIGDLLDDYDVMDKIGKWNSLVKKI